jgi:hypothetical protein
VAPASGDRFQLDEPEFEADVFTVSEMTIEPRSYATGAILAFNGTTEWALDSVAQADALWLPREDQLRELLRAPSALERLADTYRVEIEFAGERGVRAPPARRRLRPRSPHCCAASPDDAAIPMPRRQPIARRGGASCPRACRGAASARHRSPPTS